MNRRFLRHFYGIPFISKTLFLISRYFTGDETKGVYGTHEVERLNVLSHPYKRKMNVLEIGNLNGV